MNTIFSMYTKWCVSIQIIISGLLQSPLKWLFFLFQCILVSLLFYPNRRVSIMKLGLKEASCFFLLIHLCLMLITACSQIHGRTIFSTTVVHLLVPKGSSMCSGEAFLCLWKFEGHLQRPPGCECDKSNVLLSPPWCKTCSVCGCPSHKGSFCGSDNLGGDKSKISIWK